MLLPKEGEREKREKMEVNSSSKVVTCLHLSIKVAPRYYFRSLKNNIAFKHSFGTFIVFVRVNERWKKAG